MSDKFHWGEKLNVNKEEKVHWVYDSNAYDFGLGGFVCSNCLSVNSNLPNDPYCYLFDYSSARYCPYCGKEMEESYGDAE